MTETGPAPTVAVMQPYFFPYLPYYQLVAACDVFVHLDDVQYIRRGFINRNLIRVNDAPHGIVVPVERGRRADLILDKHLAPHAAATLAAQRETLRHAYARAAHLEDALVLYDEVTRPVIAEGEFHMVTLAMRSVEATARRLGVVRRFLRASDLGLSRDLRGQDRILAIARRLGARRYVNPSGGAGLYDAPSFAAGGVELCFLRGTMPAYPGPGAFVAGLSVLDAVACLGFAGAAAMLAGWTLAASR